MKKLITTMCVFILMLAFFYTNTVLVNATDISTGKCGDELNYSLSKKGVLTISGKGDMWDFRNDAAWFDYHKNPWENLKAEIKSIVFKPGITYIGADAFSGCKNLAQVAFTDTITSIGCFSFMSCTSLENFVLPQKLQAIWQQAFDNCDNITRVVIPDTVSFLDAGIFGYCDALTDVYIGGNADVGAYVSSNCLFRCCSALEKIKVSPHNIGLTAVDGVLYDKGITTLVQYPAGKKDKTYTFQATTESVMRFAIEGNDYLEALLLPENLRSIDESAMRDCNNLNRIYYAGTQEQWKQVTIGEDNYSLDDAKLYFESNCAHVYSNGCDTDCNICHAKRTVKHSYKAATCTKPKTCKLCGKTSGGKLEHTYKKGKCSACGYKPVGAKITAQPTNAVIASGKTAKVTVKATGDGLKYQWYYAKKGSSKFTKTTGTSASYSVKMSSSVDGRKIYCVVTDKYGNSVKSSTVTLYKGTPAKITTQPKSTTVVSGKTGKLELKASGSSLKYTWYVKYKGASSFTKVGSSSKTYSFKMVSKFSGAQAYCVVKDKYGMEVKSSVVTIKLAAKPKVTTQPKSVTQVSGKTVKFTVKASGEGLKYQWYYAKKGTSSFKKVSGAKSATLAIKVSSYVNGRKYYCLVTDKYGQTVKSSAATLTMKTVAKITTQPPNITVKSGKTAKVSIKAVGDGLKYNWYYGFPASEWIFLTSNTNSVSFNANKSLNGCMFKCVITDKYGNNVTSKVVTLKVK